MPTCVHGDSEATCDLCRVKKSALLAAGQPLAMPVGHSERARHTGPDHRPPASFVSVRPPVHDGPRPLVHEEDRPLVTVKPEALAERAKVLEAREEKKKPFGWKLNPDTGKWEKPRKVKPAPNPLNEIRTATPLERQQANARALNARLTPAQRSEIARKGSMARVAKAQANADSAYRETLLEAATAMIRGLDTAALGRIVKCLAAEMRPRA